MSIGVLDYGANTTYVLVPGRGAELQATTDVVLEALEASGALRLDRDLLDVARGAQVPTLEQRVAVLERKLAHVQVGLVEIPDAIHVGAGQRDVQLAEGGQEGAAAVVAPARSPAEQLGLTPREASVLELLAEGCTNREISQRLFMSEKAAGIHVSHILSKLNAPNRKRAAATAHRLGLLATQHGRR